MRVLINAACAIALAALIASPARADEWNKKTFLTFSGPVQVPGVTLPAGTYTFICKVHPIPAMTGELTVK